MKKILVSLLFLTACVKPQELDPSLRGTPNTNGTNSPTHLASFDCKSIVSGGAVVLNEIETAEEGLFSNCDRLVSITINKLRAIPNNWLQNNPVLQEVKMSQSVREIGYGVFSGSKISSITIPKSVINISGSAKNEAFANLPNLKRIIMENPTPISIGGLAYKGRIDVPKGAYAAYASTPLWRECYPIVEQGEMVNATDKKWINRRALATFYRGAVIPPLKKGEATSTNKLLKWNCAATPTDGEIVFPDLLSGLVEGSLQGCEQVKKLTFSGGFYEIESENLNNMPNLESIVFNGDVDVIGEKCFQNNPLLTSVELKGTRIIYGDIFQGSEKLKVITLPAQLEEIKGNVAFDKLDKVFEIRLLSKNPPLVGKIAFNGEIIVPKGTLEDYKLAENWKDFTNFREAE